MALVVKHKNVGIKLEEDEWVEADLHLIEGHVLTALGDVNVPSPADGHVLTFDSASGLWVAEAPSAAAHSPSHEAEGADEISARALVGVGSFEHIETKQLAQDAQTITFTGISADYVALRLVALIKRGIMGSPLSVALRLNNDSGPNYNWVDLVGNGVIATSGGGVGSGYGVIGVFDDTAYGICFCYISNVSASAQKDVMAFSGGGGLLVRNITNRWTNTTDLINRITLDSLFGFLPLRAGSWATLEGCLKP